MAGEICSEASGDAECVEDPNADCSTNPFTTVACDPNDLSSIYRYDACGDFVEKVRTCTTDRICQDGRCILDCRDPQAAETCNRADPTAIYWESSCGATTTVKQQCDVANLEVCDDSSGTPQCVQDCGSNFAQKVCQPGSYDVFYANECGQITGTARRCLAVYDEVCGGVPGDARCVEGCGDPQTGEACNSADPGALYWADRCGNPTTKKMDCDVADFEECKTVGGQAQCVRECGSNYAQRVCDPTQPDGRFYANECGDITQRFWTCDTANFEVCDDSTGTARCVQDCGTNTMVQEACNPADLDAIYWADQCGNPTTKKMDCPSLHECDPSSGTPTCSLNCGGTTRDHQVCDPDNPRVIAWANQCGNIISVADYCSRANFEVCDDSLGTPTCVRECGSATADIACNPADPGALYYLNECDEFTTKFADCDAANFEVCDDSSGTAQCKRDCGSDFAQRVCDPNDLKAVYYADECGEITSRLRQCDTSNLRFCDDSSGAAECALDCGSDTAQTVCDSADPTALYNADLCGNISTKFADCDATNFEVCDDSSDAARCVRDCGSDYAQKVCIPGSYDVYYANACGDVTGRARRCLAVYGEVCTENSGQARCGPGCGDPQTGEACNPNDPSAIYWTDRCGEVTTKKSDCDVANFEVCKTVGGQPQCVRECGSDYAQRVCDPTDPGAVYYANECGEITQRSSTCSAANFEVCNDTSGVAECVPDCGSGMSQQICDPGDRSAIYWADQCGNPTTKLQDCPAMHSCDDSAGAPTCTLDCGHSREQKVCDPSNPGVIAWANSCGEITSTYTYCSRFNFEVCDDSTGTPQCVRECGSDTAQTMCDPSDPGAIYHANACGEITTKNVDCDATNFEVCDDSSGAALCVRDCGSRYAQKACNPADVGGIYYADECGEVTQRYRGCDTSNFEICDASSGTPQCVRECGGDMNQQVCDPARPDKIFWANRCGEPTTEAMSCPPQHSCDSSGDTPVCTLDCGGEREKKICDPSDPTKIFWADGCGKVTLLANSCSTSNFEVCDDSAGAPTCVQECGGDREQLVCDPTDDGAVYYADRCGNITTKAADCDLADFEVCDDSTGDAVCARDCGANSDHKECDPADPDAVYWANGCGEITSKFTDCNNGKQCAPNGSGSVACLCEPTDDVACYGTNRLYSPSGIAVVDSCGITTDVAVEECLNGEVCREIEGSPTCWSSVLDTSSEYYIRGCTLNLYLDAPTELPMDCRCRRSTSGTGMSLGSGIIQCWPVATSWNRGHRFATGPHFYSVSSNRQSGGGVLDETTNKLYFAFNWSDGTYTEAGLIGAFDITTGERSIVSGVYKDPSLGYQTYGSGHVSARYNSNGGQLEATTMPYVQDVEMGDDGYLYALSSDTATNVEITRVDPATGERTLMWKREVPGLTSGFGQCRGRAPTRATPPGLARCSSAGAPSRSTRRATTTWRSPTALTGWAWCGSRRTGRAARSCRVARRRPRPTRPISAAGTPRSTARCAGCSGATTSSTPTPASASGSSSTTRSPAIGSTSPSPA